MQPRVGIGDMIWHLPHIRALAQHAGRVTLLARPRSLAGQFVGASDGINDIFWIERDQWQPDGRHQGPAGLLRLVAEIRRQRYDAIVLLTHSRTLTLVAWAAGIPHRYGYGMGKQQRLLNHGPYLPQADRDRHPYALATEWLAAAGVALTEPEPRLLVSEPARDGARCRLALRHGPPIALGVATSDSWKQWGAANFAELAARLLYAGWSNVLLVGGEAERPICDAIRAALGERAARAVPVLGWSLQHVAALLADSAFYVGNDTAALNIAAAVGTRAYGLFGATPVLRHSPNIVPVVPPDGPDHAGMNRITVDAVLDVIEANRAAG